MSEGRDIWRELTKLVEGLGPGQGVELPSFVSRGDVAYRLRLAFPGYLLVSREGHTFVLRPNDVDPPTTEGNGLYGRARVREEQIARLLTSGRIRSLADLGEELGVSPERARQLLKRLGLRFPRGGYVELRCQRCGVGFIVEVPQVKRTKQPVCGSCMAEQEALIVLTCLRCRETFELKRTEAEDLVAPFCPSCWRTLSPQEQRSWLPARPDRSQARTNRRPRVPSA